MTMKEIADRLHELFPNCHTAIQLEAVSHSCVVAGEAESTIKAYANTPEPRWYNVGSVEAAFAVLEHAINPLTPGHVIAGEDMGEPQCPAES